MCGFAALFDPGRTFEEELLDGIDRDLFHRGPDSAGRLVEPGSALVFRRLSILDPRSISDQPMTDASGKLTIVFNGEIYNFRQLRRDLEQAGMELRTSGDTEVILRGYALWGEDIVRRLEGMYAFIIVDRRRGRAIAARDPFGIKPLYVHRRGQLVGFASEMRPLTRLAGARVDIAALAELLTFRFAAGRLSNLEGIEKVPGGTLVTLSLADGAYCERRFADPLDTLEQTTGVADEEAPAFALKALQQSVSHHLQSDVGYALQLSGGVDSSLIAALAVSESNGQIASFGVSLPGLADDETKWQRLVASRYRLDHHEVVLTGRDFADALPRAVEMMEGPTPHFGCVMLMLLCGHIRKVTKVVLTGEGADELFGGYMRYARWRELRKKARLAGLVPDAVWPFLQRWREVQRFKGRDPAIYGSVFHDMIALDAIFPDLVPRPGARELTAARFRDVRTRMFAVDQTSYLESLLLRQDKMAMAMSVEARVPYTHWPLARAINRIAPSIRAPGGKTKPLLKSIARAYLPAELVDRRKIGLRLPLRDWLLDRTGLGRYLDTLLAPDCQLAKYGDHRALRRAVERFLKGERHDLPPIEQLVNTELWLRSLRAAS
jgi:asparagine synthase (glutamine-hydrolysing)